MDYVHRLHKDIINIILRYLSINEKIAFAEHLKTKGNMEMAYHVLMQTITYLQSHYTDILGSVDKILDSIDNIEIMLH